MIGKVVTGCVAILPYHTATQDRGSECRDFGFISRIVTALHTTSLSDRSGHKTDSQRNMKYVWFSVKCVTSVDWSGLNQC